MLENEMLRWVWALQTSATLLGAPRVEGCVHAQEGHERGCARLCLILGPVAARWELKWAPAPSRSLRALGRVRSRRRGASALHH